MKHRITPRFIITLEPNEVFVFGSNLAGIHGAGAAKYALRFGAKLGSPTGLQGNSYAIPTKDIKIEHTLSFNVIGAFIEEFIECATENPERIFLVTEIGCGLAGLTPDIVAPLFARAIDKNNIHLPQRFWEVLESKYKPL